MIHERLNSDMTVVLHFHMDWYIIHPVDGVVKVVFFLMWICIRKTVITQDNTTKLFFPLSCGIFETH